MSFLSDNREQPEKNESSVWVVVFDLAFDIKTCDKYKPRINPKFKKSKNSPWTVARTAYSREVVTFTLPINLELIRDMSPMLYLEVSKVSFFE